MSWVPPAEPGLTYQSQTRGMRYTGEQVSWQVELAVKPGELDNFRALTGEMVESTRSAPGVLNYERFVSVDGQVVHVYERCVDLSAAVEHLRMFGRKFRGCGPRPSFLWPITDIASGEGSRDCEDQFLQVDQNEGTGIRPVSLAGRLRGVLCQPIRCRCRPVTQSVGLG